MARHRRARASITALAHGIPSMEPSRPRSRSTSRASSTAPRSASAHTSTLADPPVSTLTSSSTRQSAERASSSASARWPRRSARSAAYQAAAACSRSEPRWIAWSRRRAIAACASSAWSAITSARRQVKGRAPPGVMEQLVALERLARERRAGRRVGHAALGARPRAMREDRAAQHGVGDGVDLDRRHAPGALLVAGGDRDQRVERGSLDREPCPRIGLAGELLLEERREPRLVDVDDVQRRKPGEDVDRLSRSCASARASRRRSRESGRPASKTTVASSASNRPRSSPGARSFSARSR